MIWLLYALLASAAGADLDHDGWTTEHGDCDDNDPAVHPEARDDAQGNGLDDDCDGLIDEGLSDVDRDRDGWTPAQGDCNDTRADIFPGAEEWLDGEDSDCDGTSEVIEGCQGTGRAGLLLPLLLWGRRRC